MVYTYEGKLISNPKVQGTKFDFLNKKKLSISNDVLAIIDGANNKLIRFYDMCTGKPMNFTIDHTLEI